MTEAALLRTRNFDDSKIHPDSIGSPLVLGEISYVAWVSASNPAAEVLDQATAQLVASAEFGCTLSLTNGTITVPRSGTYLLRLSLGKVSSASASGVMDFSVQVNAAAASPAITLGLLQPAVVNNFMSASCERRVALVKGDVVRAVVTGTVGGIITVAAGTLTVQQLSDATAVSQA